MTVGVVEIRWWRIAVVHQSGMMYL